MKNKISLVFFMIITFIFLSFSINSKKKDENIYKFYGQVLDMNTKETLSGVKIKIDDEVIYTDLDGKFLVYVNGDKKTIETDYISYNKYYNTDLDFKKDTSLIIEIIENNYILYNKTK